MSRSRQMGIFGGSALGAAPNPCTPNSVRSPSGECICVAGYDADAKGFCVPIQPTKPCPTVGSQRNPIDLVCTCPPGLHPNPDPSKDECIPMSWFPSCADATGARVPGCIMGQPTSVVVPVFVVGALAGLTLSLALRALL